MFAVNRFKRMFSGGKTFMSDGPFETYYGSILRDRQDGGPSAEEARRDFQHIRETVSRLSIY